MPTAASQPPSSGASTRSPPSSRSHCTATAHVLVRARTTSRSFSTSSALTRPRDATPLPRYGPADAPTVNGFRKLTPQGSLGSSACRNTPDDEGCADGEARAEAAAGSGVVVLAADHVWHGNSRGMPDRGDWP